jgi:high-affinity Fe2+/Pb2+ permease
MRRITMELRLKENWFDYFIAGVCLGFFLTLLLVALFFQTSGQYWNLNWGFVLGLVSSLALSIAFFVLASVEKKPQQPQNP